MPLPSRAVYLEGHKDRVTRIAFFSDGNRVITACFDCKARVFNADTGGCIYTFDKHQAPIEPLAVLGADLVATGDIHGVICVWDARAKCCLYCDKHGSDVWSLAALSPSLFVAGLSDGELLFFHHRGGEDVTVLHALPAAHSEAIASIASHGQRMVTGSKDRTAKVWDVDSREVLATLGGHASSVHGISMDSKHIVTTAGAEVHLWDARTLALLRKLDGAREGCNISAAILGDGHVLTASDDKTIAVSDLTTGAVVDRVNVDFVLYGAAVTSDGCIAACGYSLSAIVFPAPQKTARIMRAPAAAAAMRILGWRGGRSDKAFDANSAEVRSWRSAANLPFGL